jgi:hypothetical protein
MSEKGQEEELDLGRPEIPPPPEDPNPPEEPKFPGGGPTDMRSGWDHPSGEGPRGDPPETPATSSADDLGHPEIPAPPGDPDSAGEPTFPGGGPTDTRSGWDHPSGEGPRGDPPQAGDSTQPEESPYGLPPWLDPFGLDPNAPAPESPPPNPTDRPAGMSDLEFEQWKKDHPTMLDKANTQTDVT